MDQPDGAAKAGPALVSEMVASTHRPQGAVGGHCEAGFGFWTTATFTCSDAASRSRSRWVGAVEARREAASCPCVVLLPSPPAQPTSSAAQASRHIIRAFMGVLHSECHRRT